DDGSGTPTGTVTFRDQTRNTNLGTATLNNGVATLITSSIPSGSPSSRTLRATYNGDTNFGTSFGEAQHTIGGTASPVCLDDIGNTVLGQSVTLTATVRAGTGTDCSGGSSVQPNRGTVTFYANGVAIGSVTRTSGCGNEWTLDYQPSSTGSYTIVAVFG